MCAPELSPAAPWLIRGGMSASRMIWIWMIFSAHNMDDRDDVDDIWWYMVVYGDIR